MSNIINNSFKIIEVVSSLNIALNTENGADREFDKSYLGVVAVIMYRILLD
jgi:hypothetical protein